MSDFSYRNLKKSRIRHLKKSAIPKSAITKSLPYRGNTRNVKNEGETIIIRHPKIKEIRHLHIRHQTFPNQPSPHQISNISKSAITKSLPYRGNTRNVKNEGETIIIRHPEIKEIRHLHIRHQTFPNQPSPNQQSDIPSLPLPP